MFSPLQGSGVYKDARRCGESRITVASSPLEEFMRSQLRLTAGLLGMLALSACSDTTTDPSITGLPSLNANGDRGTTHCEGTLPAGVYQKILVLPEKTCVLNGSTIIGDVTALPRSALSMSGNQVGGNVEGHNAFQVIVQGGTVGGGIRVKGGGFPGVAASVNNVLVQGGSVEVEKLEAGIIFVGFTQVPNGGIRASRNITDGVFQIAFNNVGESVDVFDNTGPALKTVDFNTAGIAVRCAGNTPPFRGGPNFAPEREGQCF